MSGSGPTSVLQKGASPMNRTTLALMFVVALLTGAVATLAFRDEPEVLDDSAVREIVARMLDERAEAAETLGSEQVALIDQDTLNPMIENFLMEDPKILQRVSSALQVQLRAEEAAQARVALASFQQEIYDDPGHVVLGNPNGDVTLVEFFDYNCGFCRQAMPDMVRLLEEDPNLRIILKEFPVLSNDSVAAARISVVVNNVAPELYQQFHELLFTGRGQVTGEAALNAAREVGLNPVSIGLDARSEAVTSVIQRSYVLAEGLGITGTPSYIIGDEILPGAVGYEALKSRIDSMRECGSTVCDI
ncbi:MAG TPA: DsbA family protein [Devosia sp.]|nr:DsbA family protein [Devosia sp.]